MKRGNPTHCPNCGEATPPDYKGFTCPVCGADLKTGKGADLTAAEVHALKNNSFNDIDLQFQIFELKQELRQVNKLLARCSEELSKTKRLIASVCTCAAVGVVILCIWFYWTLNAYLNASVLFN